ncbi:hypothetical protein C1N32_16535 [Vibrio diazotrophicus]|uniref:Uncharacterized protein n=1 Tax=Vibrio diazotrophicus TaxID=685 RepID=A0A2J8HYW9_VIBDI|nr:hypothetical protein [Vibrio diazotrophicus]PNI03459.1 hypothetical protein C1N32_16535 [Vibrio diazotrophicus]
MFLDINNKDIEKIENLFSLPIGFISELQKENDWGLVIKAHALFEALFTQLLVEELKQPALRQDLYRLPMNGKCSKVSFLSSLDVFGQTHKKDIIKFVQGLSELRNRIVHHAENLNFNFEVYYSKLSTKDKNIFKKTICYLTNESIGFTKCENEPIFIGEIRLWIELTIFHVLEVMSLYVQNAELKNKVKDLKMKNLEMSYRANES